MAFDAGTVEARLVIHTAEASAELDRIEARVRALEDKPHVIKFGTDAALAFADLAKLDAQVKALTDRAHTLAFGVDSSAASAGLAKIGAEVKALDKPHVIKITAVFDDADIGKARRDFQYLDLIISRDAMTRLRSSPQGSVLGALNALFSPHPVIGGPSPQQSAANGLLGQMFSPQGGGAAVVPGGQGGNAGGTVLRDVTGTGGAPPVQAAAAQAAAQAAADEKAYEEAYLAALADAKARGLPHAQAVAVASNAAAAVPSGAGDLADAAAAEKAAAAQQSDAAAAQKDAAGRTDAAAAVLKTAGAEQGAAAGDLRGAARDLRDAALGLAGLRLLPASAGTGSHGGGAAGGAAAGAAAGGHGNGGGNGIGTAYAVTRLSGLQLAAANAALGLSGLTSQAHSTAPALNAVGAAAGGAAGGSGGGGGGLNGLAAAAGAAAGGSGGNGGMAGLTAAAGASGRAVRGWGGILTATVGGIALWHVALDGVLESAIALTGGLAALTVGGVAMAGAAQDIYTHLQAVNTVNQALGTNIPPLTGKIQDLQQAMAPQTIEAFGGALDLVNNKSGVMATVAGEVVTGIDNLIAKIDIWNASQQHSGQLLQDGVGFLSQFETILGNVGMALDHLAKADPGTAHVLLNIAEAASKLLNWATSLPSPLLAAGMGLHSVYVWGNVAAGVLGKLISGGKTAQDLAALGDAATPLQKLSGVLQHGFHLSALKSPEALGITAAVVAVGLLATAWHQADAGVRTYVSDMNNGLSQMTASQALLAISTDLGQLDQKMMHLASPAGMQQVAAQFNNVSHSGTVMAAEAVSGLDKIWEGIKKLGQPSLSSTLSGLADIGKGIGDGFSRSAGDTQIAAKMMADYKAQVSKLLGEYVNLTTVTGQLTSGQIKGVAATHNLANSFAIMDLAGVKASDSVAQADQKVANLVKGYQDMSVAGNLLSSSVNAVTFASLQQQSKVSALNSAWDGFIKTVSGGVTGLDSFEKSLTTLDKSAGVSTSGLGLLSASTLTVQGNFTSAVTAANSQMDALTTLASAAGLGQKGTDLLTRANQDLVASLLPAAKNSSALTTILYALAQRGGYQGADSFKQLAGWVGKTKQPMTDLNGIVTTLTTDAGNLTTDVQNLSTALGQTLNDAMAQVILTESGGLQPMENFATAVQSTGLNSDATTQSALALANQYLTLTGNVSAAHDEFVTFAEKALNLTQQQANTLWNTISGQLNPAVAGSGTAAVQAAAQIDSTFVKSLGAIMTVTPAVKADIDSFSSAILATGDNSSATASARQQLITDLENAGLTSQQATALVQGLQDKIDALRGKNVKISATTPDAVIASLQKQIDALTGKTVDLKANPTQALNAIGAVENSLAGINSKTVDLYVNTYNAVYGPNAAANSVYGSNGKLTYASGGLVGGTLGTLGPDDTFGTLRTGEYVVNAAATAKYLPMLESLNRFGNPGMPPGMTPVMGRNGPGGARGGTGVLPAGAVQGGDGASTAALGRIEAGIRELVAVTRQAPAATGEHVGAVIGGAAHSASFRSRYPISGW